MIATGTSGLRLDTWSMLRSLECRSAEVLLLYLERLAAQQSEFRAVKKGASDTAAGFSVTNLKQVSGDAVLVLHRRSRRPIRPVADPDHEDCGPLLRVVRSDNRRTREIGSPAFRRVARDEKHHMRVPAGALVV